MTDEQREELLDVWELAAPGWGRQAEAWAAALAPVTEAMLSAAGLEPGVRVLELAAGPGDLSQAIAARVAPTRVLCTDGVQAMVDVARELAEDAGVENIEFARAQLEQINLPAATADVIVCRYGIMLTVDPEAALREARRVLAPGGRLVVAVQAAAALNPWLTVPVQAAGHLGLMPPIESTRPGPFALADPVHLQELISSVGFFDVSVTQIDFAWRYRNELEWLGEKIDHSPSFAATWRELDDEHRGGLRAGLRNLAGAYAEPTGGLVVPGSALVAVAEA